MKTFLVVALLGVFFLGSLLAQQDKYPKEACEEIYDAIGLFVGLADNAWQNQDNADWDLGTSLSGVAANYATIYQVVCE